MIECLWLLCLPVLLATITVQPRLLRVTEAARMLSVSRSTCYALMDAGELRYVRLRGCRRVPREAIDELIAAATVPSRVPPAAPRYALESGR